jgi:peroxiredoxin Q/BCP
MSGLVTLGTSLGLVLVAAAAAAGQPAADLKPGDPAPAFTLPGSDGRTYSLSDFKGKTAVVLAWFPKAFTGG